MLSTALQLNRHGAALLPIQLPADLITELRTRSDHLLADGHAARHALTRDRELWSSLATYLVPWLHTLIGPSAQPVRGLVFDKTPQANWAVPWHQDLTVAMREQHDHPDFGPWSRKADGMHAHAPVALLRRMLALRIHLDDAGSDNGALRIIPGSHQRGLMSGDQLRASARHGVDLPAQAGQVIAMRPLLAHASRPSQRPQHRRVIHIECAGETLPPPLQWLEAA